MIYCAVLTLIQKRVIEYENLRSGMIQFDKHLLSIFQVLNEAKMKGSAPYAISSNFTQTPCQAHVG